MRAARSITRRISAASEIPAAFVPGALLQRCACGKKTSGPEGEECPECKKKREAGARLQRKAAPAGRAASTMAPPIVHDVLRSSGQPLDAATRAFMEPRFGYDFSRVRLHADAQAARSAEAVSAQAYTVGSNIVLGANRGGVGDRRLLAHELAHVVQQDGRQAGGVLAVAPANDSAEVAADRAADQVLSGGPAGRPSKSDGRLQRLGANPGCTPAQAASIHQGIYDANSMVGKALSALAARPLASRTVSALAHNFGPAGTLGNVPTIEARLKAGRSDMLSDPLSCVTAATDANCGGGYCGDTPVPGGHAANICADVTLAPPLDSIYRAGCVLHEAMHASNGSIIGDYYSGWFHHSTPTAVYPGPDPLNNADSYVTLAMELS